MFFVSCVFHAFASVHVALWSPAGKGLTSRLLLVMFIGFLLLYHVVTWVRCGTRFVSFPDLCHLSYFENQFPVSLRVAIIHRFYCNFGKVRA